MFNYWQDSINVGKELSFPEKSENLNYGLKTNPPPPHS